MTAQMPVRHVVLHRTRTIRRRRYEVWESCSAGNPTQRLALAEQDVLAFGRQADFYADDLASRHVFTLKSRLNLKLDTDYDVTDEAGAEIGLVREDFARSLMRTTYQVQGPGFAGTGRERHVVVALINRFTSCDFIPVHVDFVDSEGEKLFSVERTMSRATRYRITVPDRRVDFRFAAAVGVVIDAELIRR